MSVELNTKKYFEDAMTALKAELKDVNPYEIPDISSVSINVGTGKFEKSEIKEIADHIEALTGQIPQQHASKKAINGFNLKKGQIIGVSVTLRGVKAKDFLMNLVHLSLPRTKDFRGIKAKSFNSNYSAYTLGIPYAGIFPQIGFNTKINFGLQANIVFKKADKNNQILLEKLGFPFKK